MTVSSDVNASAMKQTAAPKAPSLLKAAGLIAVVTVVSKVLGAVRDWQIFQVYGASMITDAYFAAVQIPWYAIILLGGLGGPFHTATVSVFSKLLRDGETENTDTQRLANTLLLLTSVVFAVLSALVYVWAEPITRLFIGGSDPKLIALSAYHLQLMTPLIFFGGVIGIFYGLLNVYQQFFWPSISPAAMSIAISVVLLIVHQDPNGFWLAISTTIGGGLQLLIQAIPTLSKRCLKWSVGFHWKDPNLRSVADILLPMIVGTTIGQLIVNVDLFFASQLDEGGWSAIVLSNRLLQLPIGVLQTALLVPIFPRFSQYVGSQNWLGLKTDFLKGVISLWIISIPMLVMILLFSEPLVRVLFQHGSFDAGDTQLVVLALVFQAFQIIPYFARDTVTRVFYAFGDSVTPLWVGVTAIGVKFVLNALLIREFGLGGITLATSLITLINMVLLSLLVKKHAPDLGNTVLLNRLAKLLLAGGTMAAGILLIKQLAYMVVLPASLTQWQELLFIGVLAVLGMVVYTLVLIPLKIPEFEYLQSRVFSRFQTKRP